MMWYSVSKCLRSKARERQPRDGKHRDVGQVTGTLATKARRRRTRKVATKKGV